jgi:prepilin-type N-terminal cleavage/methylation domain-containing protein
MKKNLFSKNGFFKGARPACPEFCRGELVEGFTLIELLVVIVIIGVMTGVVLVAASRTRIKAADAEIMTNLAIIQSKAELYYDKNNTFGIETVNCDNPVTGNMLTDNIEIKMALAAAKKASGGQTTDVVCVLSDNKGPGTNGLSKTWAVSVKLKSDPTKWWCVDWKNVASTTSLSAATSTSGTDTNGWGDPTGIAKCP